MTTNPRATPQNPRKVRALFLSDFHMGYKGFDAAAATDFIQSHECDILYLLGDIVDGWKMETRWYWNADYTRLIDAIIDKKKAGTKILYTPGNHDEKIRHLLLRPIVYLFSRIYRVKIQDSFEHITKNGLHYVVLHGDQFDSAVVRRTSRFADRAYAWFADKSILPPKQEKTIEHGRVRPWSLGKAISRNGQGILKRFTEAAAHKVIREHADGLIYGHSHIAGIKERAGCILANCGSWTQNAKQIDHHTAIIEDMNGNLLLQKWPMMRRAKNAPESQCLPIESIRARHTETVAIARIIHEIWHKHPVPKVDTLLNHIGLSKTLPKLIKT